MLDRWYPGFWPGAVRQGDSWRDTTEVEPPYELRVNPKYLLPQCFRRPDQLADPCILRVCLPGSVLPELPSGLVESVSQTGMTPELVFCRVTPRIWAWVRWANRAAGTGKLLGFQSECCDILIPGYVSKTFAAEEIEHDLRLADAHLAAGKPPRELLPQPDPALRELVRFGLMAPWLGYDAWAEQFAHPVESPPPEPKPRPLLKPQKVKPARPALF